MRSAAILTVGTELTEGIRVDTNTSEIAREFVRRGFFVAEAISVGDDVATAAETIRRLCGAYDLVAVTGGLGPTHDDITREATAQALGRRLVRDKDVTAKLVGASRRMRDAEAAERIFTQALVIEGAEVLPAVNGTAPGQVISTEGSVLVLLPGPPFEMRPLLSAVSERYPAVRALQRDLGVAGMAESDAQLTASRVLAGHEGVALTVLAAPGDVRILLLDDGAGEAGLDRAATDVAAALGESCYTMHGELLAEVVVREATARGVTLACAESCTGGMVAAAITDVQGASAVFLGGVVSYSDDVKRYVLGVDAATLAQHGAVSEEVALAMAAGVRARLTADIAVAITGIAGPDGGSAEKPVGLVWFAVDSSSGRFALRREFSPTSRDLVRQRATTFALDLLRREVHKADR